MKLTASQVRNLEIIRKAGGTIVSRGFEYFSPDSSRPIRGLHSKTMDSLQRAGLLQAFDHEGRQQHAHNVVPARIVLVEHPDNEIIPMRSKKVKHDLNTWLNSHGYGYKQTPHPALRPAPPKNIKSQHHHATMNGGAKTRALTLSPTLEAEKYRPFSKSTKWLWWIHLPGSAASLGEGSTEAKAWQAALLRLEGAEPSIEVHAHAAIAKGGPADVRLGDKFRHEGNIWQVTHLSNSKITMTSEVPDPRDRYNFDKFVLIEKAWPRAALRRMTKI